MEWGFFLKKTISYFIQPMSIALLFLLIGLLLLYKEKIQISKKILTFGVLLLVFFSYNPVSNTLLNHLENKYPKLQIIPSDVEYILLLGGDLETRGWELLRLYNQNKYLKIITSGFEGDSVISEAIRTAKILYELGIPKKNIIIHSKPKDTNDEAIKMKELLGESPFILVTSAYHMPRAMALFQKQGTNPIAAPAALRKNKIKFFSMPSVQNLDKTHVALHEYVGLLWAKLRGHI